MYLCKNFVAYSSVFMCYKSRDDNKKYNPAIYFTLVKVFLKSCQAFEFHCQVAGLTARGVSMAIQGSWYVTAILLSLPKQQSFLLFVVWRYFLGCVSTHVQ